MPSINVDGLPEGVIRSLQTFVDNLKRETAPSKTSLEAMEAMKRAAGAWADADEDEFNDWLKGVYEGRKSKRSSDIE